MWQPIDTAPKDGTRFLAYSSTSGKLFVCRWEERPLKGGHWTVYLDGEDGWIYHLGKDPQWLVVKPVTHWMPLPEPPNEKQAP